MIRKLAWTVFLLAALGVLPSMAQNNCYGYSDSIVFGSYNGSTVDVTAILTVVCPLRITYNIGLNAGNTPGATITNRLLFGGNIISGHGGQNSFGYQLFSDSARTVNWGNSSGTNWVSGTGNGSAQPHVIYARIPANEISEIGNYADTITASIEGDFPSAALQFSVTSLVLPSCSIAASALNFGAYSGTLINSTSTITVNCNNGTAFNVGLNQGTATGATVTNRSMTGTGSTLLDYKLLTDAARTINWGNTVGVDTVAGTGTGIPQPLTVYGQLPANQTGLQSGTYSDTITATITF